ncbi:hypothetical protein ACFYM3_41730 [Streptomyces massasporeus]|uniref:Uncharacterized protein n=1 Tax=Streptomyces massasporeus TaxID=67324 RepID=A0ABW6LS40_9ACTN
MLRVERWREQVGQLGAGGRSGPHPAAADGPEEYDATAQAALDHIDHQAARRGGRPPGADTQGLRPPQGTTRSSSPSRADVAPNCKVLAGYLEVVDQWEDNALLGVL